MVIFAAFMLLITGCPTFAGSDDAFSSALELKKAAVLRTWEDCLKRGLTEIRCKRLIEVIHDQEKKVVVGLSQYVGNPKLNGKRVSTEMSACNDGSPDYSELVNCQARLLERIGAALNGETLLAK